MKCFFLILLVLSNWGISQDQYDLALNHPNIRVVKVLENEKVIAFSGDGNCFISEDDGANWLEFSMTDSSAFMIPIEASFIDNQTGYVSCRYQDGSFREGKILKTSDGGETWEEVFSSLDRFPTSLYLQNENLGFVTFYVPYSTSGFFFFERFTGDWMSTSEIFNNTYDTKEITAVGNSFWVRIEEELLFYSSADNGGNWEIITPGNTTQSFNSMSFMDENIGFATGSYYDHLYKTIDKGLNWTKIETNIGSYLEMEHVEMFTESFGIWIGGLDCSNACVYYPKVYHTYDGGNTWEMQNHSYQEEAGRYFVDLNFSNSGRVFFYSDGVGVFKSVEAVLSTPKMKEKELEMIVRKGQIEINIADFNYRVFDAMGRTILQGNSSNETINCNELKTGIYTVEVIWGKEKWNSVFVYSYGN